MNKHTIRHGFTLLELLVTLSIVAGVITVVLACFEGGFRVYARIRDFGSREADVYLAGEMVARDIGGLLSSAEYRFEMRELSFSHVPAGTHAVRDVHFHAPVAGGLYYWSDEHDTAVGPRGAGVVLIPDVLDVTFSYAADEGTEDWIPEWNSSTNVPTAVRMQVQHADKSEDAFRRTFVLVAARPERKEGE